MAVYQLKTFKDIIDAVCEELQVQSSDTVTRNRIRRDINIVYQDEIIPSEQWKWLRGYADLTRQAKYNTGTATVTSNSMTVTLTNAPTDSMVGKWFQCDNHGERYQIEGHVAGSTTIHLSSVYTGSTLAACQFQIWSDWLALPADCRETTKVTHDFSGIALENVGLQKFRELSNTATRAEAHPRIYSTSDYLEAVPYVAISNLPALSTRASSGLLRTLTFASDVSSFLKSGDGIEVSLSGSDFYNGNWVVASVSTSTVYYTATDAFTESATADVTLVVKKSAGLTDAGDFRKLMIWPAIGTTRLTLHVDYIKDAQPLENDTDEPLMPIGDRSVLLYGALQRAWARMRNPEEAARNQSLYGIKLQRMQGKLDDSTDSPYLRPAPSYLAVKRRGQRYRSNGWPGGDFGSGGGSNAPNVISGTANTVAVYDGTGSLGSSALITQSELNQLNGILSLAAGISDTQALTNKTIDGSLNTLLNVPTGSLNPVTASRALISNGSGAIAVSTVTDTELANLSGVLSTVRGISDTATLTNKSISGATNTLSAIADTSLNTISTAGKVSNSATTATSANTNSAIVARDGSGNFSAGTITAALSGNATTATSATTATTAGNVSGIVAPANGGTGIANNAASTLTISGNFATTLTVTAGTGVTLPTTGTLATRAGSETLTNKTMGSTNTLTGATVASITNTGTVTFPTATDTLVARTTTDTLTNKTMGSTNTLTGVTMASITNTGTVTFPTATDTLVARTTTDTLTNKTLTTPTINQPVIKGITSGVAASAGDVGEVLNIEVTTPTNVGTTNQWFDATSQLLTAGDWLLTALIDYTANGATMAATPNTRIGISTTSGNSATGLVRGVNSLQRASNPNGSCDASLSIANWHVNISASNTYYVKGLIEYSAGTPQYLCRFTAVRIR